MSILKYAAGVPVVAAVVASLYGGLSYVNALQNTIEGNEKTIITMELTIQANNDKINMRLDNEVSGIMTWGNGSFENNTSLSPASSLSNAQYNTTVTSSSSFGQTIIVNSDGDIDLFKTGGVLLLGQLLGSKSTRRRLVYCSRCKRL